MTGIILILVVLLCIILIGYKSEYDSRQFYKLQYNSAADELCRVSKLHWAEMDKVIEITNEMYFWKNNYRELANQIDSLKEISNNINDKIQLQNNK